MLIWWLSGSDCARLGKTLPSQIPSRVAELYAQRRRHIGRSMLYAPPGCERTACAKPNNETWEEIQASYRDGIVIYPEDLETLPPEVGIVTNLKCEPVSRPVSVAA